MSGLFRDLGAGAIVHPDEPKQVLALLNFIHGNYVKHYNSLFYDGYPYGLNHLDEYLLRPFFLFLGFFPVDKTTLYYIARLLRVAYGMITVVIAYKLVYDIFQQKKTALLAMLLMAIAPLSITVSHFAAGDIGVDFFTALCFLFLLFYTKKQHNIWLFASGITVGAAFSAKYNGFLLIIVPALVLLFEFAREKQYQRTTLRSALLLSGTIAGALLFTPNLLLEFTTALTNISANFKFIKNYNVPSEILEKTFVERALLGLKKNSLYIITSLGVISFFSCIGGAIFTGSRYSVNFKQNREQAPHVPLTLAIALFPILSLFIALSGKYTVQPFHFSYLQLPIIIAGCSTIAVLSLSRFSILKGVSVLLALFMIIELGHISLKENFFWRAEDTVYYEKYLPESIFTTEALTTKRKETFRSLYVEPTGTSVFKNIKHNAKGPDTPLWQAIQIAPIPETPNPIGQDWIFLNGPTFPRNDKTVFAHGQARGVKVKKYLVLPIEADAPALGIRSGSYATEAHINYGNATTTINLEPHQQKTILLDPKKWRVSKGEASNKEVKIIPLEVSVPHNDVWITLLTTEKEKQLFTLFGGGQDASPTVPETIPEELAKQYETALQHIRYLEVAPLWKVQSGETIPMWEVTLPAGYYKLTCEIEGLTEKSTIQIELEDAKGELHRQQLHVVDLKKGLQKMEFTFSKPFTPYQGRLVISSTNGDCLVKSLQLFPDYQKISTDFEIWRDTGVQPEWISRFRKESIH